MTLTPEELRDDVVAGLVEHGFKRADAELAVRESIGDDFSSLFRDALDRLQRRRGRGEIGSSSQNPGRTATPDRSATTSMSRPDAKPGPATSGPGTRRREKGKWNHIRAAVIAAKFGEELQFRAFVGVEVPRFCNNLRTMLSISKDTGQYSWRVRSTDDGARVTKVRRHDGIDETSEVRASNRSKAAQASHPPVRPNGNGSDSSFRVLSAAEFSQKFRKAGLVFDAWTADILEKIRTMPPGFAELTLPEGRSAGGLRDKIGREFRNAAFRVRCFTGGGREGRSLGIVKEAQ